MNNVALAQLIKMNKLVYEKNLRLLYSVVFLILIPISITLFVFSDYIVTLLVGDGYLESVFVLKALSIVLPLIILNNLAGVYYGLYQLERIAFYKNLIGFFVALVVSLILIDTFGSDGVVLAVVINVIIITFFIELILKESNLNAKLKFQSVSGFKHTLSKARAYYSKRLGDM